MVGIPTDREGECASNEGFFGYVGRVRRGGSEEVVPVECRSDLLARTLPSGSGFFALLFALEDGLVYCRIILQRDFLGVKEKNAERARFSQPSCAAVTRQQLHLRLHLGRHAPRTQDVKTAFCPGSKAILPYFCADPTAVSKMSRRPTCAWLRYDSIALTSQKFTAESSAMSSEIASLPSRSCS